MMDRQHLAQVLGHSLKALSTVGAVGGTVAPAGPAPEIAKRKITPGRCAAEPTDYQRVSPARPYVASWTAYGGHKMFVGAFQSAHGGTVLLATDVPSDAAGFESPESCAAALLAHGYSAECFDWLNIGPMKGQLALF